MDILGRTFPLVALATHGYFLNGDAPGYRTVSVHRSLLALERCEGAESGQNSAEYAVRHFPVSSSANPCEESKFSAFFAALNVAVIGSLVVHVNVQIERTLIN